jgi:hypothetical protein
MVVPGSMGVEVVDGGTGGGGLPASDGAGEEPAAGDVEPAQCGAVTGPSVMVEDGAVTGGGGTVIRGFRGSSPVVELRGRALSVRSMSWDGLMCGGGVRAWSSDRCIE